MGYILTLADLTNGGKPYQSRFFSSVDGSSGTNQNLKYRVNQMARILPSGDLLLSVYLFL